VLLGLCLGTDKTNRIDEPARFATSALSNVATEVVEAVLIARDATSIFASAWTGLSHKLKSARSGSGLRQQDEPSHNVTAVVPSAPAPAPVSLFETPPAGDAQNVTSHSSPTSPSAFGAPSSPSKNPASEREERVERGKNELAARLAHEDFGEKCALMLACSIGVLLQDSSSGAWVNAAMLAILEGVADEIKHYIYASHGILVQRATFKHGWVAWLGVVLCGTGACTLLLAGIRLNCMLGDSIAG
jgi:hypothetical protein